MPTLQSGSHLGFFKSSCGPLLGKPKASSYAHVLHNMMSTSSNNFACTPCMQAHPCLYLCWHVAISVHELLQVCRDRCSVM